MPEFIHDQKVYYNPVEFALSKIGGTWKMPVLWRLKDKVLRYNEIKKTLPRISDKMLTSVLKDLEKDGFTERKVYPEVPPRVEYKITIKGKKVIPVINTIREYGLSLMEEEGIKHT